MTSRLAHNLDPAQEGGNPMGISAHIRTGLLALLGKQGRVRASNCQLSALLPFPTSSSITHRGQRRAGGLSSCGKLLLLLLLLLLLAASGPGAGGRCAAVVPQLRQFPL